MTSVHFSPSKLSNPCYCASDHSAPVQCASDHSAPVQGASDHSALVQCASDHSAPVQYASDHSAQVKVGLRPLSPSSVCLQPQSPSSVCLWPKPNTTSLSSSEINKKGLQTTNPFFIYCHNLKGESKARMLAVRLARMCTSGKKLLASAQFPDCEIFLGYQWLSLESWNKQFFRNFHSFGKIQLSSNNCGPRLQKPSIMLARRFDGNSSKENNYLSVFNSYLCLSCYAYIAYILYLLLLINPCSH